MTIWLHAMSEAAHRAQQAWNWWGATPSPHSAIAEAISQNQCWKDGCRKPELEPLGLCREHLEQMKRESIETT